MIIKAAIIGGAGYTAGELLRILLHHPQVEIAFVHSTSNAGNSVATVHTDFVGETALVFTNELKMEDINVVFLCMGHGKSRAFLEKNELPANVRIIDLSHDYRLKETAEDFVYGLPELNRAAIRNSTKIANPGCFATAIQLALLPLAKAQLLQDDIHIHAITGSTGAGQQPTETTHFTWRNNNISIYKAFQHQHLDEIRESLTHWQSDFCAEINFLPLRGNFTRGIFASVYLKTDLREKEAKEWYQDYYKNAPFVVITEQEPHLKQVVNTNKCVLSIEKIDGKLLIISMIDNLTKGASGQAVQNMNLMFGLEETLGLGLKGVGF